MNEEDIEKLKQVFLYCLKKPVTVNAKVGDEVKPISEHISRFLLMPLLHSHVYLRTTDSWQRPCPTGALHSPRKIPGRPFRRDSE